VIETTIMNAASAIDNQTLHRGMGDGRHQRSINNKINVEKPGITKKITISGVRA
jgi:hypothetical protein